MWSIIGGALGVVKVLFGWLGLREERKERDALRKAGSDEEKLRQHDEAQDARDAMDSVEPTSRDDIIDRVRRGEDL